jgi:hypothetical protein
MILTLSILILSSIFKFGASFMLKKYSKLSGEKIKYDLISN